MKIIEVKSLAIPEVKVIRFGRFNDHRGYFTETFRRGDFDEHPDLNFISKKEFIQANESYSKAGTMRGLHFQWNPYMGKLVRTLSGRMIDMAMDIRKDSPTYGKIIAYDMPVNPENNFNEWIWVPVGFAHGNFFTVDSMIEYYCTGDYSPNCEVGISPLSADLDWSLCEPALKAIFDENVASRLLISDKDRNGLSLSEWTEDERSENFIFDKL